MSVNKFFAITAACVLFLLSTALPTLAKDAESKGPLGVFFAPHMEVGPQTPEFIYQEKYWPRLVDMIAIADQYDANITLLFNPQWASYILMDRKKYDLVKQWQRQGHEVGLHYHLVTHVDWCGYTNRTDPEFVNAPLYRGTVADMMALMNKLAAPERIVTACNGPDIVTEIYPFCMPVPSGFIDEIDFPNEIIYDIDGIRDGRTIPIGFRFNRQIRFHLRHGVARTEEEVSDRLEEIASAEPDEIIGLVTHASDYDPMLLKGIFQHLHDRQIQVQTVGDIMEKFHTTQRQK